MGLDELIAKAQAVRCNLTATQYRELAELAFAMAQARVRARGGILTPALSRDYSTLGPVERDALAQMAEDYIRALVALDWVDVEGL